MRIGMTAQAWLGGGPDASGREGGRCDRRRAGHWTGGGPGPGGSGGGCALLARSAGELAATAAEVGARGHKALPIRADVTDPGQLQHGLHQIANELGPVAILVNNAGIAPSCKYLDTADDLWQATLAVNLTGPFRLTRAVLPDMLAAGWGRIINMGSTAARTGYKYTAAYVASKHGLLGLTRAATENLVTATGRSMAEARKVLEAMSPQAWLMTADEVAAAVVHLTTEAARGINGQSIVIDGGGVQA